MKRNYIKTLLLCGFMGIQCSYALHLTYKYDSSKIQQQIISVEDINYITLNWDNSFPQEQVGEPSVPVFCHRITLPIGAIVNNVTINPKETIAMGLTHPLLPSQAPQPISNQTKSLFALNKVTYTSDTYYPSQLLQTYRVDYLHSVPILSIFVSPLQYNPTLKRCHIATSIEVDVDLNTSSTKGITYKTNSTVVECGLPYYEYTIITHDTLSSAFETFASWKRAKGYEVGIVNIGDILNNQYLSGDTISGIFDDAGKLRQYLSLAYQSGKAQYILLGGDHNIVPIRYGTGDYDSIAEKYQIPSDWYYADLNGNWNIDNDLCYGEPSHRNKGDNIDYAAELYVGRILCTNRNDIQNWTSKVLRYEINPGNGDYTYLTRALFTQADQLQDHNEAGQIRDKWMNFECEIINEIPTTTDSFPHYPKGADIINMINSNHYGLLGIFNHGGQSDFNVATCLYNGTLPDSIHIYKASGMSAKNYAVTSCDAYTRWTHKPEIGNSLEDLNQELYPAIVYSVSCTNIPFDNYEATGFRNLGEVFTCVSKGGGPAYLGYTRSGYVTYSTNLYKLFIDSIKMVNHNHIGMAETLSKWEYRGGCKHWLTLAHNLIGCPEMPMWTQEPKTFDSVEISINDNHILVNTNEGSIETTICLSGYINNQWYQKVYRNNSTVVFDTIPDQYNLVITKSNFIPYITSSENCYLQNANVIARTKDLDCTNVYIGESVTPLQPTGGVNIQIGGKVNIRDANKVLIKDNVHVRLGGELHIY